MAKQETNVTQLKINRGTYAKIQENLAQIGENELIITTDKNVPIPAAGDSGKVVKVNASGEYELGTVAAVDTWRQIKLNGSEILGTGTSTNPLDLVAGANITLTNDNGAVTITATDTDTHYTAVPVLGGVNATTNATSDTSDPYLNIIENNAKSGGVQIKGGGDTTVVAKDGVVTISSTNPTVNDATLTIKAEGTTKGTFSANASQNVEVNITAADLNLSSALRFLGAATTTQPSAGEYVQTTIGSTTYYVSLSNEGAATEVAASKGDVIVVGTKEYVCNTAGMHAANAFQEIGDESSYALKTVTVTGTGALSGGGNLTENRTITHNEVLGTAETTAKVFKTKIDVYGHISEATAATPADIGAEAAFVDGSATIASVASDIVTLKAGVTQTSGAIGNSSAADITLAKVAKTGAYSDLSGAPTLTTVEFVDWS